MGRSFRIGRIFGFPVRVDFSWFLGFILFSVLLSTSFLPDAYPEWDSFHYWTVGVAIILLLFGSVLAHELSHSIVSRRKGIPVKSITLFIFGGMAQIDKEAAQPKTELLISLAGPASSLLLAGIFYGIAYLCRDWNVYLFALAGYLSYVNLILAAFNMIPGFPLDGGRVLRAVIWMTTGNYSRATRISTTAGSAISIAMIAAGVLIFFLWGYFSGIWLIFIGFILNSAARTNYQQTALRESLKGYNAQDIMIRDAPRLPRYVNLMDLVEGAFARSPHNLYLVTDGDDVAGILTIWQIRKVPQRQWSLTTVAHIMVPVERMQAVSPTEEASSVLERFARGQDDAIAVSSNGKFVGIITRQSLFDFARRIQVLKG